MSITNFPHGLASMGVPVLPGIDLPIPGNVYWVGATAGLSWVAGSNAGATSGEKETPFATIDYAIGKCTANNGDVIYVLPGHTESIIAAGTITMDVAGVTIIGLGTGTLRPTFTFTTVATATFLVTAANCSIYNLYFDATGVNGLVKPFDIQAENFKMQGCEVYFAKTSYVALEVMSATTTGGDGLTLLDNHWHGDAVASCTNALQLRGGANTVIKRNIITGNFSANLGPINHVQTALTNITIDGNILENRTALANKVIVLLTGSTGRITNNRVQFGSTLAAGFVTADSCGLGGNYFGSVYGSICSLA